jgi:alpha-N-arabinofuranosidase
MSTRLGFLVATLALGSVLPLRAQQAGSIVVNASQVVAPVNRLVFGQNIEAADNARIFSSDRTDVNLIQRGAGFWDPTKGAPVPMVLSESRAVGTSLLRYPGGCLVHDYDWRRTVGPGAKQDGWLFGLDEYLSLCRAIGAVPLITISDYVLTADQIPENAAELVEYLNSPATAAHPWAMKRSQWGHSTPYDVTWFELGNESMHGNHRIIPRRQYTAEQYAAYFKATAAAMRRLDPRIKLGIVTIPGPGTDVNSDWNQTVIRLAGASADFVVIHLYAPQEPNGVSEPLLMQTMAVTPHHVEERLTEYHQMIKQQLGHDLPLAITEFNGALNQGKYFFSLGNALECADLLRVFLQPEFNVALASYWNFLNGSFGMLRTTEDSPTGEPATEEPALLLYKLWAQHFGSQLIKAEVHSPVSEFPGVGSEEPDRGSVPEPRRFIQNVDLNQYSSQAGAFWAKLMNVQIQRHDSDFAIRLQNLNHTTYPLLARIPRPSVAPDTSVDFSLSFDAKFTPDAGSDAPPMGIGLIDSRGWSATHSGIGVDGVTSDWKHFNATYSLTAQTQNVDLNARLLPDSKNVSGTLQIRNLVLAEFAAGHAAAYPLLTCSASRSSDGRKLYLVVFNKSAAESIGTSISLNAFSATTARFWEANGPGLSAVTGVTMTEKDASFPLINASTASHVFPAHSMTAIEFDK